MLAATKEEQQAAALAVLSVLRHPLLDRARRANRLHREYPVTIHANSTQVVEGIIDLAFLEEGGWVIVDFKSDTEVHELAARYGGQISWYAAALERIFGLPVQSYLLAV
jgi:ATP-dependent helicase/nuclease subunit A